MTERLTRAEREGIRKDAMRWGISPHIDTVLNLLADLEAAEAAIMGVTVPADFPYCPVCVRMIEREDHAPDCLRAALEKERGGRR